MNFWKVFKVVGFVLLAVLLGFMWLTTPESTSSTAPTVSASPAGSSDAAAFGNIK